MPTPTPMAGRPPSVTSDEWGPVEGAGPPSTASVRRMWLEDARTDFALAVGAAFVVGDALVGLVSSLPGYPSGVIGVALFTVWVVLLGAAPARWLVANRGQGPEGYGLHAAGRSSMSNGLVLAVPVLAAGYVVGVVRTDPLTALLGRVDELRLGMPADGVVALGLALALVLAAAVSIIPLHGLLSSRAVDAFRSDELPLVEALRTFGMGAAGVATVLGLLLLVAPTGWSLVRVAMDVGPLVVIVLLVDRQVDRADRTTRAGVLAPAIVAAVAPAFLLGGGNLLGGLYVGTLGFGLSVVVTSLITTRRASWAVVPLLLATVWSPTCLSLPVLLQACALG